MIEYGTGFAYLGNANLALNYVQMGIASVVEGQPRDGFPGDDRSRLALLLGNSEWFKGLKAMPHSLLVALYAFTEALAKVVWSDAGAFPPS